MSNQPIDQCLEALKLYKEKHPVPDKMTTAWGAPVASRVASLTAGPRGPLLMQDFLYFEEISKFDRERVPERVVHAKGTGVYGVFEVTHDITKYTKACMFSEIGKKTPMFVRFSTVAAERGAPDTIRDPRGFAMKFYTEEGNFDLVANNTPLFFHSDPIMFPSFIHALKRNPKTNLRDANMFWDFLANRPEAIHQWMFLFGDRGIPDGYRFMDAFGANTFKLVNKNGEAVFCKFIAKSCQGKKNLTPEEAEKLAGADPDYSTRDLFNAIERGDYPKWDFFIQVMTIEEAQKYYVNPFDVTKIWRHKDHPLIPVGRFTLNKLPTNYFAEVEQVAFCVSHMIPGIEPSPDKMLLGRMVSYRDTQYHRLGTNYLQLPINCPYRVRVRNIQTDGEMVMNENQDDAPLHFPNSFNGPQPFGDSMKECPFEVHGLADRYDEQERSDNFSQPRLFWTNVLDSEARLRLVKNICKSLGTVYPEIRKKCIDIFYQVHEDFGKAVEAQFEEGVNVKSHCHYLF